MWRASSLLGPVRRVSGFFGRLLPTTARSSSSVAAVATARWRSRSGDGNSESHDSTLGDGWLELLLLLAAACRVGEAVGREGFVFGSGRTRVCATLVPIYRDVAGTTSHT